MTGHDMTPKDQFERPADSTPSFEPDPDQRLSYAEAQLYAKAVVAELDPYVREVNEDQLGGRYHAWLAILPDVTLMDNIQRFQLAAEGLINNSLSIRDLGKLIVRAQTLNTWWDASCGKMAAVGNPELQDIAYAMYRLASAAALQRGAIPPDMYGNAPEATMSSWGMLGMARKWLGYASRFSVMSSSHVYDYIDVTAVRTAIESRLITS